MNPDAFEWMPEDEGVCVKTLGTFTERGARIGFVRIDPEGVYKGGAKHSIEILFLTKGQVVVDNVEYGPESAFELLPSETVPIRAVRPTEFLSMVLHKF